MGHGIFPEYGMQYSKTWMGALSPAEKKEVFFTSKQERAKQARESKNEKNEENEENFRKRKKK